VEVLRHVLAERADLVDLDVGGADLEEAFLHLTDARRPAGD